MLHNISATYGWSEFLWERQSVWNVTQLFMIVIIQRKYNRTILNLRRQSKRNSFKNKTVCQLLPITSVRHSTFMIFFMQNIWVCDILVGKTLQLETGGYVFNFIILLNVQFAVFHCFHVLLFVGYPGAVTYIFIYFIFQLNV